MGILNKEILTQPAKDRQSDLTIPCQPGFATLPMNKQNEPPLRDVDESLVWLGKTQSSPFGLPASPAHHLVQESDSAEPGPWSILIVGSEPGLHPVDPIAFKEVQFAERSLKLHCVQTSTEAIAYLRAQSDIACILLNLRMEQTTHAGLGLVRYIREELNNANVRIILGTEAIEEVPKASILLNYDIEAYHPKEKLTGQHLVTTLLLAVRSYGQKLNSGRLQIALDNSLVQLQQVQKQLQDYQHNLESKVAERTAALNSSNLQLQRLAAMDGLTQVPNRRSFDEYLEGQWQHLKQIQQPLALIMLDVDYFKDYNDHYGHRAGDECLQQLAQSIAESIRRPQDLVARYGGEEFAILLPNTPAAGATRVAKAVLKAIAALNISHETSEVVDLAQQSLCKRVTFSAGISWMIPQIDIPSSVLVEAADRALYRAKQQGRNCIQVYGQNHTA